MRARPGCSRAHRRNPSLSSSPRRSSCRQNGSSTTSARRPPCSPTSTSAPGSASRRIGERDRPVGRGDHGGADPPHLAPRARSSSPSATGGLEPQAAQVAVGLALVVQAGDRLLADVAALGEADGALVDPRLLGDRRRRHLAAEARAPRLDPEDLGRLLGDLDGARPASRPPQLARLRRRGRSGRHRGRSRPRSTSTPWRSNSRWACSPGSGAAPATSAAAGPISEGIARRSEASSTSTSRPTLYMRRWRTTALEGVGLGVEPDLLGAETQDSHVGLHVPLAVEQGRVAALARLPGPRCRWSADPAGTRRPRPP